MKQPRKVVERFVKVSELKIPVTLQVEFDRPVPIREARQVARRVLDRTVASLDAEIDSESFAEAKLKCGQLQRIVMLARRP